MRIPYTYLIGWPEHNVWYYGVRYANGCYPSELWITYFTSSKYVDEFIKKNGQPSVKQVRKIFSEGDASVKIAREYEHRVLRRLRVAKNEKWLNKTHNKSLPPLYGKDNPATRLDIRNKISNTVTNKALRGSEHPRRKNPEKWAHQSELFSGRDNWWSKGQLNAMNDPKHRAIFDAVMNSPETKANIKMAGIRRRGIPRPDVSDKLLGVPKEKITCPHCGKVGGKNTMGRWHFDNCKYK
jgi:hypothetical protein